MPASWNIICGCAICSRGVLAGNCEPGSPLEPGHPADFFTIGLNDPSVAGANEVSLLSHIVFCGGRRAIQDAFVAGKPVIENGRHPQHARVIDEFVRVQRSLWGS